MKETVFNGRDNPNTITVKQDGVAMDFSAVTRMTCSFYGVATVADSDVDASLIDWSAGDGVIVLSLNDLAIPAGLRDATLVAYDPQHPDGQVIAHKHGARLQFEFVD